MSVKMSKTPESSTPTINITLALVADDSIAQSAETSSSVWEKFIEENSFRGELSIPRQLNISDNELEELSIAIVKLSDRFPIHKLDLSHSSISNEGLGSLRKLHITDLNLNKCKNITGLGLNALKGLNLTSLELSSTQFTTDDVYVLNIFPALKNLNVSHTKVVHLTLLQTPRLQSLNWSYCEKVFPSALLARTFSKTLEKVDLRGSGGMNNKQLYVFKKLAQLKEWDLRNCPDLSKKHAHKWERRLSVQELLKKPMDQKDKTRDRATV